jgi:hypothetical protein
VTNIGKAWGLPLESETSSLWPGVGWRAEFTEAHGYATGATIRLTAYDLAYSPARGRYADTPETYARNEAHGWWAIPDPDRLAASNIVVFPLAYGVTKQWKDVVETYLHAATSETARVSFAGEYHTAWATNSPGGVTPVLTARTQWFSVADAGSEWPGVLSVPDSLDGVTFNTNGWSDISRNGWLWGYLTGVVMMEWDFDPY